MDVSSTRLSGGLGTTPQVSRKKSLKAGFRSLIGSGFNQVSGSGSAPEIYPDPGGQKCPKKVEKIKKFQVLKCWMSF
jgi:hypothetical protein